MPQKRRLMLLVATLSPAVRIIPVRAWRVGAPIADGDMTHSSTRRRRQARRNFVHSSSSSSLRRKVEGTAVSLEGRAIGKREMVIVRSGQGALAGVLNTLLHQDRKETVRTVQAETRPWPLFSFSVQNELAHALTDETVKTIVSAINTLPDDLLAYVMAYTPIGGTARQKNAITSGAYVVESPEVLSLDGDGMEISVGIRTRSFFGQVKESKETVRVPFGRDPPLMTAEAVKRRLMEMSRAQGRTKSTAIIYKIPVGSYGGLPPNMLLNNVPHSRLARNFIYRGAADALISAVQDPAVPRRMKLVCTVPELNPAMDTYRIGTLLEMVRELAYSLADVGLNTRILIQPSMGQGIFKSLPLALSGVMNIMQGMDWEDGLVGEHVNFGALGEKSDVSAEDDVILVISPQSIAGYSVHQLLVDTVEEAAGKAVVIINPNLKDRPSSGGVMQVKGRGERISFAESFKDVYNFRLLYSSSVAFFPIKGAVMKSGPLEPYVVFSRRSEGNGRGERYNPLATFDDDPDGEKITPLFGRGDQ